MQHGTLQSLEQGHKSEGWKFCLLLTVCSVAALSPLVHTFLTHRYSWPWSWTTAPGIKLLLMLAIALADQAQLTIRRRVAWHRALPSPLLCAALVLIHDWFIVRISDEMALIMWLPLVVLNLAIAVKAWLAKRSVGSLISLLAATYLLSIFVRNFVEVYSFEGMFGGEVR